MSAKANPRNLNVVINQHTYDLFMEYVKDMDIPISALGAWLIQTNINEVPKNKSAIITFYKKREADRREKWSKLMHRPQQAVPTQQKLLTEQPSFNQTALLQAFKDMIQPMQDDLARLKADLGV
jgi:hypothetical protein